jgi:3-hydroxyisobutyrate dehydrogenase-like beta-hydroxyacid dehydrogenase
MGHVVGRVLIEHGMKVTTCLKGRSKRTETLAQQSGIETVPTYNQLVGDVDLILSILVPAEAERAAKTVAEALKDNGEQVVYVDCNAIAPASVREVERIIMGAGSVFVDAGIIGAPPTKPGTTRFYVSGSEAEEFAELSKYGLDIRVIGREAGQASGLKMAYAAFTKGVAAISTELLTASWKMGLYEVLAGLLREKQAEQYDSMEHSLPGMPTRARRWVGEMEEIAKTFEDLGLTPRIHQGAADIFRFVSETSLADETPETIDKTRTLARTIEILAGTLG